MTTPNLAMLELETNQQNPENTYNDNLIQLDSLVQLVVEDMSLTAPPGSPVNGTRYIPLATATGDWAGKEDDIAYYYSGWYFTTPTIGWTLYNLDTGTYKTWNGTIWGTIPAVLSSEKVASYTVVEADLNTTIVCNHSSAITITLDDAITTLGSEVRIINRGAGTVTIAKEGSDTLETKSSLTDLAQYTEATAIRIASTVWLAYGDLS